MLFQAGCRAPAVGNVLPPLRWGEEVCLSSGSSFGSVLTLFTSGWNAETIPQLIVLSQPP